MQQRKTATFTYEIIYAKRKTMSMKVEEDGKIVVRAPHRTPGEMSDRFVESHGEWILKRRQAYGEWRKSRPVYTEEEKKRCRERARVVLEEKCRYYSTLLGVDYKRISIREQKTRWGSCSAKGNLNFNWKLILMPEEIQDYLVVHELSHRKEMNHSKAFWSLVEAEIPDYRERRTWLKAHGREY